MKLHANARTCPNSRRLLIKRTARKWLSRWRAEGERGLLDRSSAPTRVPRRLPAERVVAIEMLRPVRMTAAKIAEILALRSPPSLAG